MALLLLQTPSVYARYSKAERLAFQKAIIDKQRQLHHRFKKITRNETKYIIVHTSEAGLKTTLKLVSKGKFLRGRRLTYGGHANYVTARNGRTYRILDKKYEANHAGLSMWNGETDISKISIGIELVGYHYTRITDKQYRSVGILIDILQDVYHLDDSAVLTHSQVAYGEPNRWFKKKHRGRKRCAKNFDRAKAGL
jgi:N-acetyl-anhydromuramyl-L-alanine amidase AmpD